MWKFISWNNRAQPAAPSKVSKRKRLSLVFLACLLLCGLATSSSVRAQTESGAPIKSPEGRHFIVLIDDSGSLVTSGDRRPAISAGLPRRLFKDIQGLQATERDRISVVFFTILLNSCGGRAAQSALPENMFQLAFTMTGLNKDGFDAKLRQELYRDCRMRGNWSPIAISSLLVLPFLQDKLPAGELHSQTILLQVTDGKFNAKTPSHELLEFQGAQIKHTDRAEQLLYQVSRLFYLDNPPEWQRNNQEHGVFYLAGEYKPQRVPEAAIQYQRNSLLYPQALSSSTLRYRLNDQLLGDIQLLSQGGGADFDFKPLWLRVSFKDEQGEAWRLGGEALPREDKQLDLTQCQKPQCERSLNNDRLGVGLFEAGLGRALAVSRFAADPAPGQIDFAVGFYYDTLLYKHLCAETPRLQIKARPAPPAEIPNLLWPTSEVGKNEVAAEWTRDDDGVTTQDEAKNRILAWRNVKALLALIAFIIATILLMVFLFLRFYHRRFAPKLHWLPAPEPVVDFDFVGDPPANRLLVGTLKVVNDEPVPWLGQWLKNEEQPTRQAVFTLSNGRLRAVDGANDHQLGYNDPRTISPVLKHNEFPIGFVCAVTDETAESDGLAVTIEEAASDGKQVYVFLASEVISDFQAPTVEEGGLRFDLGFQARMDWAAIGEASQGTGSTLTRLQNWLRASVATDRAGQFLLPAHCNLTITPEKPRRPLVSYTPVEDEKLCFKLGQWIEIGQFVFKSQADHKFALPYEWGDYTIQTHLENDIRQMGGEPIRLGQPRVTVPPDETVSISVYLYCDGQTVPNPDPVSRTYAFKLVGDFNPASEAGPHKITLYRDPMCAEIELKFTYQMRQWEIYWTPRGELKLRSLPDGTDASELRRDNETIVLTPQAVKFSPKNALPRNLLGVEIGNSGTAGRGVVSVDFTAHLQAPPASIEMEGGRSLEELLGVYLSATETLQPQVIVNEQKKQPGQNPQTRDVRLYPGYIERIPTARIEAEHLAAEVRLNIRVRDDQAREVTRVVTIQIPLSLEQLPGLNWLAIDFGTSAIAAAIGTGRQDGAMLIPLQEITVPGGQSFAQFDTENAERVNHYLLPSWVVCDADIRKPAGDRQRPGFSGYYSEKLSLTPGEADFLSLPAVKHDFEENHDRIIYSLKSWLGKASRAIRLDSKIRVKENGNLVERDTLPLDKVVESGFAALAEGYLLVNEKQYRTDQIVLAHPNTFTKHHRDLLHSIVYRAFSEPKKRFGIPLPERIRLISESDAVAYFYCATQMAKEEANGGTERLLVYDFGAGTLDLSLIKVEWQKGPDCYPKEWKVEKRLGVPVAGNYIDEILARLIHRLLTDPAITDPSKFNYRFPVVSKSLDKAKRVEHRRAIIDLWNWIREAKHEWSDACRKVFAKAGNWRDCPAFKVKVGIEAEPGMVGYVPRAEVPREPLEKEAGLWIGESGYIHLSIPTQMIQADTNMKRFTTFVTREVIDELLDAAHLPATDVDTVIVSGRGALYPGLRDLVWKRFPDAGKPDLFADEAMKEAVVLGAIARQDLSRRFEDKSDEAQIAPRLAVLINDQRLVFEEDWDKPIDLAASPTFRLVQVNRQKPNPREDMRSLRKHFYIDVADQHFRREDILGDDTQLYVRKEMHGDKLAIYLEGRESSIPITNLQVTRTVTKPPWPVGNVLLDPQD